MGRTGTESPPSPSRVVSDPDDKEKRNRLWWATAHQPGSQQEASQGIRIPKMLKVTQVKDECSDKPQAGSPTVHVSLLSLRPCGANSTCTSRSFGKAKEDR